MDKSKNPKIFISYKSEEIDFSNSICEKLAETGLQLWFDRNIQCGAKWEPQIDSELKEAYCVLVLWSPQSVNSEWVKHEALHAMARGVYAPCKIAAGNSSRTI